MGVSDSDSDSSEDGIGEQPEIIKPSTSTSMSEKQTVSNDTETKTEVSDENPEANDAKMTASSKEPEKNVDISEVEVSPADESSVEPLLVEVPSKETTATEPQVFEPINLDEVESAQELELLGLEYIKQELQRRGLKCGGTLSERASRLFSVKGLTDDQINPKLFSKPPKK